jgi:hypothetical protein
VRQTQSKFTCSKNSGSWGKTSIQEVRFRLGNFSGLWLQPPLHYSRSMLGRGANITCLHRDHNLMLEMPLCGGVGVWGGFRLAHLYRQGFPNRCRTGFRDSKKPVGKPVKPISLLVLKNIDTVCEWEPDRFVYRAGPVPPGTAGNRPNRSGSQRFGEPCVQVTDDI